MGANAVTSIPVYADGEILDAARLNVTNSGIPVFATTTTRDAGFGGTGEKVLAEGQMAYIENIAGSSAVQYYDGSAWQTLVQSGLTLIKAQAVGSGVTSVTLTSVFSATYDDYLISGSGITFTGGALDVKLTLNGSAGSTYSNWGFFTTTGLAVTGNGGASMAYAALGISSNGDNSWTVQIKNPFKTAATQWQSAMSGPSYGTIQNGIDTNAASSTQFTITTTGTMTGGNIRVYGYQNS